MTSGGGCEPVPEGSRARCRIGGGEHGTSNGQYFEESSPPARRALRERTVCAAVSAVFDYDTTAAPAEQSIATRLAQLRRVGGEGSPGRSLRSIPPTGCPLRWSADAISEAYLQSANSATQAGPTSSRRLRRRSRARVCAGKTMMRTSIRRSRPTAVLDPEGDMSSQYTLRRA